MASSAAIHLSELLGKLHARHRREQEAFDWLTDDQREELAARSTVADYFRGDAWELAAAEVGKRTGIGEGRLGEFAGAVNLGAVGADVQDVAALVAGLDTSLTPILLTKLAGQYPDVVKELGLEVPADASGPRPAPDAWLTLDAALPWLPGEPSRSTVWRWCTAGVNGVRLEHGVFGGTICITLAAVDRFGREAAEAGRREPLPVSVDERPGPTPRRAAAAGEQDADLRAARKVLEAAGIRDGSDA